VLICINAGGRPAADNQRGHNGVPEGAAMGKARSRPSAMVGCFGLVALQAALLAGCGGGGGGDDFPGSGTIRSTEYYYNKSLEDIDAAAAYERGFTGSGARIHLMAAHIMADDQPLQTNVTRQFEVGAESFTEIAKIDGRADCMPNFPPGCISPVAQIDTIKAQLMAEPRDGWYGHGVAYRAEVWAYDFAEAGARANAIRRVAAGPGVEVLHLDAGPTGVLSADDLTALASTAGRKVVTMPAPAASAITVENWQPLQPIAGSFVVVGTIDGNQNPTSAAAGPARDNFLVLPSSADQPYTPAYLDVSCNIIFCFMVKRQASVHGPAYAQAVASGAASLLQRAYPYLSASQVARLMLSTARDIGAPGVDEVYGHGALDLERATRPVGTLAVATGQSVDGKGAPVEATRLALGAAFGDALGRNPLLANGVAFDAFGRPFEVGLDRRVGRARTGHDLEALLAARPQQWGEAVLAPGVALGLASDPAALTTGPSTRFDQPGRQRRDAGPSMALDLARSGGGSLRLAAGLAPAALLGLGDGDLALSSDDAGFLAGGSAALPQLTLVGAGNGLAARYPLGGRHDLVLALAGDADDFTAPAGERRLVQAISRHRLGDALTLGFGLGLVEEDGTFLASEAQGAFADDVANRAAMGSVLGRYDLPREGAAAWALEGGYTLAVARPEMGSGGLLRDLGTVTADAWSLGLVGRGVAHPDDRVGLMLAQPFRVTSASGTLDVPVGRDLEGGVLRDRSRVALTPSGREVALEVAYGRPLGEAVWLATNLFFRHEPGHEAGSEADLGALARLRWRFAAGR
jgi:hypothetical protein